MKCSFLLITFNVFRFLIALKTLRGSRNIQGLALIRAVLSKLEFHCDINSGSKSTGRRVFKPKRLQAEGS